MSLLKTTKRESFFGFITEHGKTAYDIKKMILDRLDKEKLDSKKYRGIGFDNVASIPGVDGGVQRVLRNIDGKAKFMPCSNQSEFMQCSCLSYQCKFHYIFRGD